MVRFVFAVFAPLFFLFALALPGTSSAQAQATTYRNVAEYCRAVGTIAEPGPTYAGPVEPRWIDAAVTRETGGGHVVASWRCATGRVKLCVSYRAMAWDCIAPDPSLTPVPEQRQYCRERDNRNSEIIPLAAWPFSRHEWRCQNGQPVLVSRGLASNYDAQGYRIGEWTDITDQAPPPPPAWPLPESTGGFASMISSNYGAHGPGPATNPNTYLAGQYHPALDIRAPAGDEVVAPVAGTIIYYHRRRNSPPEARWIDTFIVLRARNGQDWILGHVDCSVCSAMPEIGDSGSISSSMHVDVAQGQPIGVVAPLRAESERLGLSSLVGDHLHLSIVSRPVVDSRGRLNADYRGGQWAFLAYSDERRGPTAEAARAAGRGFTDPAPTLRAAFDEWRSANETHRYIVLQDGVRVRARRETNLRDRPSARGNAPIGSVAPGTVLTGEWVEGSDGTSRWFRYRSDATGSLLYIWGDNLDEESG